MEIEARLQDVRQRIADVAEKSGRKAADVALVAVSKTFEAEAIQPVIDAGQRVFGENRVQEAQGKWPALKEKTDGIELHLIGPLQSNKALAEECSKQGRSLRFYVQVNTGLEPQKAGIDSRETIAFVALCRDELKLAVEGLMCIPPADENPGPHFALLAKLAKQCGLEKLSMGMSGDFETAVEFGATSVRVGSAIFGTR